MTVVTPRTHTPQFAPSQKGHVRLHRCELVVRGAFQVLKTELCSPITVGREGGPKEWAYCHVSKSSRLKFNAVQEHSRTTKWSALAVRRHFTTPLPTSVPNQLGRLRSGNQISVASCTASTLGKKHFASRRHSVSGNVLPLA